MKAPRILQLGLFVFFIMLASCSTKDFVYLHEKDFNIKDTVQYHPVKTLYLVQPEDVLFIKFHSVLSDAESYFKFSESASSEYNLKLSEGEMYINQYVVSDSGFIKIPVIGNVFVLDRTISDIETLVELEARKYITDATAKVKLVSFKITFLGEFKNPGEKYFYRDNVNILDAIAIAGDMTYNGNRKKLRILRNTPDGIESFRIDLNDVELLNSTDFYLKPNDIVYAEPLPRKIFQLHSTDYSILLVALTSTLALVSIVINTR